MKCYASIPKCISSKNLVSILHQRLLRAFEEIQYSACDTLLELLAVSVIFYSYHTCTEFIEITNIIIFCSLTEQNNRPDLIHTGHIL